MKTQQHTEPLSFDKVWQMFQETREQMKETDKKINKLEGFFTGQWGKFMESLVEGDLVRLLKQRKIDIEETYPRAKRMYKGKEIEIDIIAANGTDVVAVEVKTIMKVEDVNYFLDKLKIFRKAFHRFKDNTAYGAIAYLKVEEEAVKYAYRQGLFVIKATGKSAIITNDKKFKPKTF
jgi:RecB family endonuclease NucS